MKLRNLSGVAIAALLVAAACQPGAASPTPAPATDAPATDAPMTDAPTGGPVDDPLGVRTIPAGEPIHIVMWGVLSGPDSSLGIDARRGVEIALDDRPEVAGHPIEMTSEDGLCTPEGGNTVATRVASDPTVVGLVGSTCSDETVGGIEAITNAGLTTISHGGSTWR